MPLLIKIEDHCINISEPGGAIGVASKWNSPSMAAHADRRGFSAFYNNVNDEIYLR